MSGDPYYSNVSLLLHCDGTNGSTTFTDNSPVGHNVTASGNAQVGTTVRKYGTGALLSDGSGDYLTVPSDSSLTMGTGDFTFEFWIYTSTHSIQGGASRTIMGTSQNTFQAQIYIEVGTGKVIMGNTTSGFSITGTSNVANGAWHHVALVRNGTTAYLFVDGNQEATGTNSINYSGGNLTLAAFDPTNGCWNGSIDDFRITKGVARYTSNFTPPTEAFPNSGLAGLFITSGLNGLGSGGPFFQNRIG